MLPSTTHPPPPFPGQSAMVFCTLTFYTKNDPPVPLTNSPPPSASPWSPPPRFSFRRDLKTPVSVATGGLPVNERPESPAQKIPARWSDRFVVFPEHGAPQTKKSVSALQDRTHPPGFEVRPSHPCPTFEWLCSSLLGVTPATIIF